ncbi:MAG TPA: hypothetical protein VJ970_07865, partial [Flavobacteriaceae bacterium]|nr:hypothetical protein [Flavobacteriaceae bacterium]
SIEKDFDFTKQSVVKIYSASLMGGKSLAILPSYVGEPAEPGDFLQGEIESDIFTSVSEKLNPLQAKVENVIVSADSLMVGLNEILNYESRTNLKTAIRNLSATVASFRVSATTVNEMLATNKHKLNATLTNAQKASDNLVEVTNDLAQANISETINELEATINSLNAVVSNIENGNGTVGKLIYDDEMYNNLKGASQELEELLRDIKLHPKRFVHFSIFGKKDKGYKPETSEKE